jgi:excisionase family DNA binding protein
MASTQTRPSTRSPGAPQFAPGERFLTVGVVAEYFGVTEVTIKNWVDAGQLRAARTVGGHRRIAASSVVKLLEEQGRPIPAALARKKPLVVVLEGDAAFGKQLKKGLAAKTRIEAASDAYAGLLLLARVKPEVVVVDMQLAGSDIRKLITAIRSDPQTRPIDVVAVGSTSADAKAVAPLVPATTPPRGHGSLVYVKKGEGSVSETVIHRLERPNTTSRRRAK